MKKTVFILPACLVLLGISCNKEASVGQTEKSTAKFVDITCTLAPDAKITLADDGKTEWEATDKIFIHGNKVGESGGNVYSYVAGVSTLSADKKTATFSIPADMVKYSSSSYNSTLFAVYPAEAVSDFSDGATWYFYSSVKNTDTLILGGANDKNVDDGLSFEFLPLTGAISFIVDGSSVDGGFDSYVFSGNNNETVGYTHYVFRTAKEANADGAGSWNNNYNGYKTEGPSPSAGALTAVSVEDWDGADGTTVNTVYFPNPDGFTFTGGFTFKFLKDGEVKKIARVTSSKRIKNGQLLPLGDITSHLIDAPVEHTNLSGGLDFSTATDLSAAESANCYVITAPGQYKFKAVQGNSSVSVGNLGGSSLLWETYNNATTPTVNSVIAAQDYYVSGDDKYIVFKTPDTLQPGNALIAATNAGGTILWSWHIWIPETAVSTDTYGIAERAIMDRYLGALSVASEFATAADMDAGCIGLLYQWGRKDPFPNVYDAGSRSPAKVAGTQFTFGTEKMSMEDAIANPTQINALKDDWNSTSSNDLWGAVSESKTINDPCPPGYKVPTRADIATIINNTPSELSTWGCGAPLAGTSTSFTWFKLGEPSTVFPNVGMYNYDASYSRAYRSVIWCATQDGDALGKCKYIYEGPGFGSNARKSQGGSIRCIVE